MARAPKYMAVQGAALLMGAALVVLGALGFIPGITAEYDRFAWAAVDSGARLFGSVPVCGLYNVVTIGIGVAGFLMARTYAAARAYFLVGGAVYLGLWAYGLAAAHANHWLLLVLGIVMVLLALTLAGQHDPTKRRRRVRA